MANENTIELVNAPFTCTCSPQVPELLFKLKCTIVISTYQAGKVIFLSAQNEERLIQLPRTFQKAMGIAIDGDKLAIACKDEIITFANSPELGWYYPKQPKTYDALYMPRITYHTSTLDVHDLEYGNDGLYAVNTLFNCIMKTDDRFNFIPVWKPPFISSISSEDRCHLNGMAMQNGKPRIATAIGSGDVVQSWRSNIENGGVVMDLNADQIIFKGLPMPHSPRLYGGDLYLLYSATGEVVKMNLSNVDITVINRLDGFVRGMARHGDYLFIGLSKLRKNSSAFRDLPIADKARYAGISILHLPTGAVVGEIKYLSSVEEIYDVQILPGIMRANILNTIKPEYKSGLTIPGSTYWAKTNTENNLSA